MWQPNNWKKGGNQNRRLKCKCPITTWFKQLSPRYHIRREEVDKISSPICKSGHFEAKKEAEENGQRAKANLRRDPILQSQPASYRTGPGQLHRGEVDLLSTFSTVILFSVSSRRRRRRKQNPNFTRRFYLPQIGLERNRFSMSWLRSGRTMKRFNRWI